MLEKQSLKNDYPSIIARVNEVVKQKDISKMYYLIIDVTVAHTEQKRYFMSM